MKLQFEYCINSLNFKIIEERIDEQLMFYLVATFIGSYNLCCNYYNFCKIFVELCFPTCLYLFIGNKNASIYIQSQICPLQGLVFLQHDNNVFKVKC